MTLERTAISKDVSKRGAFYAAIPNRQDAKGGLMTVARIIKQDKTANFANADSKRLINNNIGNKQNNFPKHNPKVVYETITMPIPMYLEVDCTSEQVLQQVIEKLELTSLKKRFGPFANTYQEYYGVPAKVINDNTKSLSFANITNEIKGLKAKHIIVIADSCYSGTIIVERGSEDKITRQQKNKEAFIGKKHKKTARIAITSGDIGE